MLSTFQSTRPVRGATTPSTRRTVPSKFQSTRPVRGATKACLAENRSLKISIHAPRAGRDNKAFEGQHPTYISIHAPRAGRDTHSTRSSATPSLFQSTRPVRGATSFVEPTYAQLKISIHAPRAGRDCTSGFLTGTSQNFNPRAPCGARRTREPIWIGVTTFQSTRPVRGATDTADIQKVIHCISIHAPRAGRDASLSMWTRYARNFNPRAPCGARLKEE